MDDMPQTIPETDPLILNHAPIGASPGGILARMDGKTNEFKKFDPIWFKYFIFGIVSWNAL